MIPSTDPLTAALHAHSAGELSRAEQLCRNILEGNPQHAASWHLLGVVATQSGRPQDALEYIGRAITIQPDDPAFRLNYGVALRSLGRKTDAVASFREALRLQPDFSHAHNNLANVLHEQGDRGQAASHWGKALEHQPSNTEARCNFVRALIEELDLDGALNHARQAIHFAPKHAAALRALGDAYSAKQQWTEAEVNFRQALRLRPEWPEVHVGLADVLQKQNKFAQATEHLCQALQIAPNYAPAHNQFGIIRGKEGQMAEAILHFEQALRLRPHYSEAHHNLAVILKMQRRFNEAAAHLGEVLKVHPHAIEPVKALAGTLDQLGRTDEAITVLSTALQRQPTEPSLHAAIGTALSNGGRVNESAEHFREALRLKPDLAVVHSCLLDAVNYHPDLSPEELFAEHRGWDTVHSQVSVIGPPLDHDCALERRLRIGYVSGDFIRHIAAQFFEPILAHHDQSQVEVFCYADVAASDERTARFWSLVGHWKTICDKPDAAVAKMIQDDRIDILVDLAGHTGSRLGVFASRPAPVQVTYLGYPNTTGLAAMDYRLTDAIADPPGEPICHTEELLRLPGGFCCYAPPVSIPEPNPLPALSTGSLTFGSLHKMAKLNDHVLDLWCRVLQEVTSSRLLLFRDNLHGQVRERLRRRFAERGVDDRQLLFPEVVPGRSFLQVYQAVDIALDVFPWNGHATACEGMWMGVPILTLAGNRHASRMVASVLTQVGLPDWIAQTPGEFVAKATSLPGRIKELAVLRAGLRDRMRQSLLCDGKQFTQHLEAAYREMWRRWVQNKTHELHR